MKDRGKSIEAPLWWVELARKAMRARDGGLVVLGKQLATAVGRSTPYNHGLLSKFLAHPPTRVTTQEFTDAVSIYFKIPRAYLVPRSYKEAVALEHISSAFDNTEEAKEAEIRSKRKNQLSAELHAIERESGSRTDDVDSSDEVGEPGSRRSGGIHRRRRSSTGH
jgi:hypothetical protein